MVISVFSMSLPRWLPPAMTL
uniref:Uncharacterized protein n=1 Tax=Arundo donax TaxID=35708 RepID=A0A0A9EDG9_ARUDO